VDVLVSTSEEIHLSHLRDHIVLGPSVVDAIPGYVYSYIVFGRRFLDGDVEVGGRFLRAYLRGARDFVAGKNPQFLLDFIRSNGLDPDTPDRLCRQTTALDGRVPLEDIQRFADWAVLRELCPGPVKAEDLVDMRFIEWLRGGKIS
jgi:ABC-type nitrate/sulfonate/bicarbonate transport system substrate-binding protein